MKKLLFTFATGAFLTTAAFAQSNLDCETWTGLGLPTVECTGWGTLNSFTLFGAPQTTFEETADPGEGTYSARIETAYWLGATQLGASSDTVSGFFTIGAGPSPGPMGIPYTDKPTSVDFMLKADLETGDTGAVFIQLSRWDVGTSAQVVIAQALVAAIDSGAWGSVTATPFYFNGDTPDTIQIICVSSMGSLFGGIPLPIIGSSISIDAFVINVPVGIGERDENVKFSVYPNPATDYVVIKNGSSKSTMDVEMMDINGKVVRNYTDISGGEMTIDGSKLAKGSYFIKVTSGGKQVIRQVIFQ